MKIIITGISGLLGWNLAKYLIDLNIQVIGIYNNNKPSFNIPIFKINLMNYNEISNFLKQEAPDYLINCAAIRDTDYCENHKKISKDINIIMPLMLNNICKLKNIKFITMSTDLIFDGKDPPYTENSEPSPLNTYGNQKALMELQILTMNKNALIFRIPLMYGFASPYHCSFLQELLYEIDNKKYIYLSDTEIRNPVNVTDVIYGIWKLKDYNGILHLGGLESISRFEFGKLCCIIKHFNMDHLLINSNLKNRPTNLIFKSNKAISLGYNPNDLKENLLRILM